MESISISAELFDSGVINTPIYLYLAISSRLKNYLLDIEPFLFGRNLVQGIVDSVGFTICCISIIKVFSKVLWLTGCGTHLRSIKPAETFK